MAKGELWEGRSQAAAGIPKPRYVEGADKQQEGCRQAPEEAAEGGGGHVGEGGKQMQKLDGWNRGMGKGWSRLNTSC